MCIYDSFFGDIPDIGDRMVIKWHIPQPCGLEKTSTQQPGAGSSLLRQPIHHPKIPGNNGRSVVRNT